MSLVSELPGIVAEAALTRSTGDNVLLVDEESGMQVEILTPVPVVAIRLGRGGVSHAPGLRKDKGLESICDYLLVVELNGNTHAVLVELKKTWGLGLPGRAKKIHERVCRYGGHVPIRGVWRARTMTGAVRWGPGLGGTPGTCASNTSNEKRRS